MNAVRLFLFSCCVTLFIVCFELSSTLAPRPQATTPAIPNTPAGRQLAGWLAAFNTEDTEVLRPFISDHYAKSALQERPAVERAMQDVALNHHFFQGLNLYRIEESTDTRIVALARTKVIGFWVSIMLEVEPLEPHAILRIDFDLPVHPANLKEDHKRKADIVKELSTLLKQMVAADIFSGTVLVAKDGKPLFAHAYGFASKAYSQPNRIDTRFYLASVNKMFTAVAIAQLAEQGKLSFRDPLSKYLPDYPNRAVADKVTLHQLLTHISGIPDYYNAKYGTQQFKLRTLQDYIPLFAAEPLHFQPGERWEYSNSNYILLGIVIEKVSGQRYHDYIRKHIFEPAGMSHTNYFQADEDAPNVATGYTGSDWWGQPQRVRRNSSFRGGTSIVATSAGGGYSTVEDLLKFATALRGHRLLDARSTDTVLSGKADSGPDGWYAYGFFDARVNGKRILGHTGAYTGASTVFDMYPDLGFTVIILSNYDPPTAMLVQNRLREIITQQ